MEIKVHSLKFDADKKLIDFTENDLSESGNPVMEANPGGAPCNVLAMLQKLGKHCVTS